MTEVADRPMCEDCHLPADKWVTTAAQLYGIPPEDYPAYPSAFVPRWDGEWICPKCRKIVAVTNPMTGERL